MRRYFLVTQMRACSMAFACFGLAAVGPPAFRGGFGAFLLSPPGLAVVALGLVMLGLSIEETGTVRRIRLGVAIRLLSFGLVFAAGAWAVAAGALGSELAIFGSVLFGLGVAGAAVAFLHDKSVFVDIRHGQALRLEKITANFVSLHARGGEVITIPTSSLRGVALARDIDGRGVFVLVRSRDDVVGQAEALPWVGATREGDTLILTEHEAGLDAEVLASRLTEAAAAAREGGYR